MSRPWFTVAAFGALALFAWVGLGAAPEPDAPLACVPSAGDADLLDVAAVPGPVTAASRTVTTPWVVSGCLVDASQRPVAGAQVRLAPAIAGAVSDQDGAFALPLPVPAPHTVTLVVAASGLPVLVRRLSCPTADDVRAGTLVLATGGVVCGSVHCEAGPAVAVAAFTATAADPEGLVRERVLGTPEFTTGGDGRFTTGPLAAGAYQVVISAPGHERRELPALVAVRDGAALELPPVSLAAARVLRGVVRTTSGCAVAGALVTVAGPTAGSARHAPAPSTRTDAAGGFVLDHLPAAAIEVRASAPCGAARLRVDLAAHAAPCLELVLDDALHVAGRVVAADDGKPVTRGVVRLSGMDGARAPLDGQGCFALTVAVASPVEVAVDAPGFVSWRGPVPEPLPAAWTVVLPRAVEWTGLVREAGSGEPIPGAQVTVAGELAAAPIAVSDCGALGRFALVVPGGRRLSLRVTSTGHVPLTWCGVPPAPVALELLRTAGLHGRVLGVGPGLEVVVRGGEGMLRREPVDASGRFTVSDLLPGPCTVWCGRAGALGPTPEPTVLELAPGEDRGLVLRAPLGATGSVRGQVEWQGNTPAAAYVRVAHRDLAVAMEAAVAPDGSFATGELLPAVYRLTLCAAAPEHRALQHQDVLVEPGAPTQVVLRAVVGAIRGRLVDTDGKTLGVRGAALVALGDDPPHTLRVVDGEFQSQCLPCGAATLVVRVSGQPEFRCAIEVRAGPTALVALIVPGR